MSFQQLNIHATLQLPAIMEKEMIAPVYLAPLHIEDCLLESSGEIGFIWKKKGSRRITDRPRIRTSRCAYKVCRHYWNPDKIDCFEEFKVLYLSHHKHVLEVLPVSQGGITGTVADPRLILVGALKLKAKYIVLAHNHPSGNLKPSDGDKKLTTKIKDAARFLDITVLDHIIMSSEGYFSFEDNTSHTIPNDTIEAGEFSPEKLNAIGEIELIYKKKKHIKVTDRPQIKASRCIHQLCIAHWNPNKLRLWKESRVLFLNRANRVVEILPVSNSSVADPLAAPRQIIARALKVAAVAMVFVSNQPFKNLVPTREEEVAKQKLKQAGNLFDVALFDHIIFNSERYYSLADQGIL